MNIQGFAEINRIDGTYGIAQDRKAATTVATEATGTQVSLSDRARALSASDSALTARLEGIKAKPAILRSAEEADFVRHNDKRLAELSAIDPQARTADEVSYLQKAGGFVNTMANLSPAEKALHDELVAKGDTEAVRGMSLIALSRMGGGDVTLSHGRTFDPTQTPITADNVRQLFSQMVVGTDGQDARSFDALATYLDSRSSSAA